MKKKHFLYASTILLGLMTQSALGMEVDPQENNSITVKPTKSFIEEEVTEQLIGGSYLPGETLVHILSFLEDQKYLLSAKYISKALWAAAKTKEAWENTSLKLSDKKLSPENYKALAQGPWSKLILNRVGLSEENIPLLLSSKLPKFTHLDLRDNPLGNEGAEAIATADNLRKLRYLYLSNNSIEDKGAKAISDTKKFPGLKILDLTNNLIKDVGEIQKRSFANFRKLTILKLIPQVPLNIGIGPFGGVRLATANFSLLRTLNLSSNRIQNEEAQ